MSSKIAALAKEGPIDHWMEYIRVCEFCTSQDLATMMFVLNEINEKLIELMPSGKYEPVKGKKLTPLYLKRPEEQNGKS